jgi:hypothetical protein
MEFNEIDFDKIIKIIKDPDNINITMLLQKFQLKIENIRYALKPANIIDNIKQWQIDPIGLYNEIDNVFRKSQLECDGTISEIIKMMYCSFTNAFSEPLNDYRWNKLVEDKNKNTKLDIAH